MNLGVVGPPAVASISAAAPSPKLTRQAVSDAKRGCDRRGPVGTLHEVFEKMHGLLWENAETP